MGETKGSWERVARAASDAFLRRGYGAVSLRSIADALSMKPASLYFHCPGGKAELYVRSLAFAFENYRAGLEAAGAGTAFPQTILAMARWMMSQSPVDMRRIANVDQPAVAKANATLAEEIPMLLHTAIFDPFHSVLIAAATARHIDSRVDPAVVAAAAIAIIEGLGGFHAHAAGASPDDADFALVADALTVVLRGAGAKI